MARAHHVFRWLIDAGTIASVPTLYVTTDFWGKSQLHSSLLCESAEQPTPVSLGVDQLETSEADVCMRCIALAFGDWKNPLTQNVYQTMVAVRLLEASEDTKYIPIASLVPDLMAERVHQVIDYVEKLLARGDFGSHGGPLADGVERTLAEKAQRHPRPTHEAVMAEATRVAATFNATRRHKVSAEVTRALIAGLEPSQVLELATATTREAVTALIDEVEQRIIDDTPAFVSIACYPTTLYHPATTPLEVAVIASARYFGHHRVIGELSRQICEHYPERQGKDNRSPHPHRLDVEWEPVEDDVIEAALLLWRQSGINDLWQNLSAAFETAIALG